MPGAAFFSGGHAPVNGARLGFASMNEVELMEAVGRLAGCCEDHVVRVAVMSENGEPAAAP